MRFNGDVCVKPPSDVNNCAKASIQVKIFAQLCGQAYAGLGQGWVLPADNGRFCFVLKPY